MRNTSAMRRKMRCMQTAHAPARTFPRFGPRAVAAGIALACCEFACLPAWAAAAPAPSTSSASGAVAALGSSAASAPERLQTPARTGVHTSAAGLAATAHCNAALHKHPLELHLDAASQPKQFDMDVRFFAPVPTQTAWQAMTDYGAMASYMPGMERSEVIAADGDSLRVLQTGSGGIAPFRVTLSSTLDITLHGHVATWFTTRGNLDSQGRAEVWPQAGGSAVHYSARLQPRIWLPPLLGLWFMRDRLQQQMTALRQRMCVLLGEATVQSGDGGRD